VHALKGQSVVSQGARTAETLVIGGAGAALLVLLRVPAGAVLGALVATAAASLAGRSLGWPDYVRQALYVQLGFSAGATVTPAAVGAITIWPLSLVTLAVTTLVTWAVGWRVFRWLSSTDRRTAFFAASPGALGTVLVLAEQQGTDLRKVAVAQSLRLVILVCLAPLATATGRPELFPSTSPALVGGLAGWAIAVAAVLAGWRLALLFRWPAPPFMGALVASILVHATGLVHAKISGDVLLVTGAALGALIGSRFAGLGFGDLAREARASLALVAVMALIGVPVGIMVGDAVGVGALAGVMAFAPGSMEVLVAVALTLNAHPAYVAVHHLTRTLLLLAALQALPLFQDSARG
jgi:membrane AbrB-like protein